MLTYIVDCRAREEAWREEGTASMRAESEEKPSNASQNLPELWDDVSIKTERDLHLIPFFCINLSTNIHF